MSFNLNKTDEEAKSAFDLDKGAQGGAGAAKGDSDEKSPSKMLWLVIAVIAIGGLAWMMTGGQGEEETQPLAEQVEQPVQLDEEPTATSPVGVGGEDSEEGTSPNATESADSEPATPDTESPAGDEEVEEEASAASMAAGGATESTNAGNVDPSSTAEQPQGSSANEPTTESIELPVLGFAKSNSNWNQASNELDGLVRFLKSNPTQKIELLGYASSEGDPVFNQWISKKRAQAIADRLIAKGIGADRISVVGKGSQDPVASNATEAGRSKNRRVEINLK